MNIVIIDYGMGNIHSLKGALKTLNHKADIYVSNEQNLISEADLLFLPGVGHFKAAMDKLESLKLTKLLRELVLYKEIPIMGICLGMQLLFRNSLEGGFVKGLGFFDAEVRPIRSGREKIPHIGFNTVVTATKSKMFKNIKHRDYYFVHSYCVNNLEIKDAKITYCDYNESFIAAIELGNIWGTQFHPEKSQDSGLHLINNFLVTHAH
jgi:imidazole glycerol-phosphate synthase subunit HisH